ncbi:lytic transglycosylase domain-containing protein [Stenotrophomonas sp.]|uniref:lytic transglycosylase domain-containing protein n=1 Tax=Stenotrophomonas sp. TaxID=69392 RepID=UPI0028A81144|nr:lytic transglycosylase domain-containing protein [Stenotrophomonas sp.]
MPRAAALALLLLLYMLCGPLQARTVYRCVQKGTVSMATAPEPGSSCKAMEIEDNAVQTPNLWGNFGVFSGTLYEREQDGKLVYSTRNLPGSTPYLRFTVATPPGEPAHAGLGRVGTPQLNRHAPQFRAAAKATGVDDAWLRAVAHAESAFDEKAVSPKGAQGVMQLMPDTATEYGVTDPLSAAQSINGGARYMKSLLRRYNGDRTLAAAAYNAGIGVVTRYGGVPPYAETRQYVDKVLALYSRYREAMGTGPERPAL